jgi:hypothetical protein
MDDPSLAPRLDRTALDGTAGRPGLTYRIDTEAAVPAQRPRPKPRPAAARPTPPAVSPSRRGLAFTYGALLVLGAAGGPAGAWWLSVRFGGDPSTSLLCGIAAGLLVAGMALAWKRTDC